MRRTTTQDLEKQLNPEQIAAVTHGDGPQLVLAGAGSGKTRVITYRIAWLVEERGVDPGHVAAMTFTNKAAAEMRERVEDLLGLHPLPTSVGTFHRYGLILLRRYGERVGLRRDFAILDTSDQIGLVKEALSAEGLSETAFSPRAVLSQISGAKNKLIEPAAYESAATNFFEKKVASLYRKYQGLLAQASGVDFDDLLTLSVKLLSHDPEVKRADPQPHPVSPGGRVPGHEPCPAPAHPGADRPERQPHGRGRRGPGDLPLARRGPRQHPRLREETSPAPRCASWSATTAPPRPSSTSPAR